MKLLLIIIFLHVSILAEETLTYTNEISLLLGNSENGYSQNIDRSAAYQLQFQYNDLDFPIKPEFSFVYSNNIPLYDYTTRSKTRYINFNAHGVYDIPYTPMLTPYVKAGLGYIDYEKIPQSPPGVAVLSTGAGIKLHFSKRYALKFEVALAKSVEHLNITAFGGLNFSFGRKYEVPPKPQQPQECAPCKEKTVYITKVEPPRFTPKSIYFVFGKAALTPESKNSIQALSQELNNPTNRNKNILIIGYTDSKGTRGFNATLSLKRAQAVKSALIKNNVKPQRIEIDGFGELYPIADNSTEEGRERNRRVVIILDK